MPLFFFSLSLIAILFYTQVEVGTSVVCPLFQGYCHAYRSSWLELPSQRWGPQSKQPINVLSVFLQKKIFRSTWLTFYLPLMPILLCTFDWLFIFFSLVRTCTCNCFWKGYTLAFDLNTETFFICFHAVFFLYIINSADIFYTPTARYLWSKMNPSKNPTFWLCLSFFQDFFI